MLNFMVILRGLKNKRESQQNPNDSEKPENLISETTKHHKPES